VPDRVNDIVDVVERFVEWANQRPDVVGAALVGSHARGDARPGSDVDLIVLTPAPDAYVDDHEWVRAFGTVESIDTQRWGAVTSLKVRYARGPEVELGITTPAWASTDPVDPGTARVVRDGFRVLFDPTGALGRLVTSVDG
jgi:hypothetical protein